MGNCPQNRYQTIKNIASVGSRVTHNDGLAVLAASEELRRNLLAGAAQVWGTERESLACDRGAIRRNDGARPTLHEGRRSRDS